MNFYIQYYLMCVYSVCFYGEDTDTLLYNSPVEGSHNSPDCTKNFLTS